MWPGCDGWCSPPAGRAPLWARTPPVHGQFVFIASTLLWAPPPRFWGLWHSPNQPERSSSGGEGSSEEGREEDSCSGWEHVHRAVARQAPHYHSLHHAQRLSHPNRAQEPACFRWSGGGREARGGDRVQQVYGWGGPWRSAPVVLWLSPPHSKMVEESLLLPLWRCHRQQLHNVLNGSNWKKALPWAI